jgi:DNA-binding XRE family transcriptional regulator
MFARGYGYLRQTDWRIFFGIIVTAMWLIAGMVYVRSGVFNYETVYNVPLDDLGSFLEGAFAPLAFLWLVIGLFIQQRELADNTEVLRQTSIQSEKQTQAIAATEMNARQETFFKIAENVRNQLGGITGMLFISSMGASEGQRVSRERIEQLWHMLARRDDQVFAREFLLMDTDEYGGYEALFYETEIRRRHTRNFMTTFDRLMLMARNCDSENGIITDSLAQTAHGLLYNQMRDNQPEGMDVECAEVDTADYVEILERSRD